jgi:hypothetical protein
MKALVQLVMAMLTLAVPVLADLCGQQRNTATGYVRVTCVDYPAMRRITGMTLFPDKKAQQIWIASSDASITGFRVTIRYREAGREVEAAQYIDRLPQPESAAFWLLGDVQVLAVTVTELRPAIVATLEAAW